MLLLYVLLNSPISNFGSQYLYIMSIMSPLEPERAAEARRAVVASINSSDDLFLRVKSAENLTVNLVLSLIERRGEGKWLQKISVNAQQCINVLNKAYCLNI